MLISNGEVLGSSGLCPRDLHIANGIIVDQCTASTDAFDAKGGLVLPGIVDLHGDAFERALEPRPGVYLNVADGLHDVDRQLIANGITTAFHAFTVSWEAGIRSLKTAREIFNCIQTESFRAEICAHIRWEVFAVEEAQEVIGWLASADHAVLSINDHTTPYLQQRPAMAKLDRMASRMGLTVDQVEAALKAAAERSEQVERTIDAMCEQAASLSIPMLSHDDRTLEDRQKFRRRGIANCEFPMTMQVARDARQSDEPVILGAPNIVRGGSQNNAVDAQEAINENLCSALVSDYHYPSLMKAAFQLAGSQLENLSEAWQLVSQAPARIAGFQDRGDLSVGARADMLVFWPGTTALRAVFVNGSKVLEYG